VSAAIRGGRRTGTQHGELRAAVLGVLMDEDPESPLSDDAVGAVVDRSQQAITEARRALGVPNSRDRAAEYRAGQDYGVSYGLAHCEACCRWIRVPPGRGSVVCPANPEHGRLVLSSYRLRVKRPR
jgi:hypothetical protein